MFRCPQCATALPNTPELPDPGGRFAGHFRCPSCALVSLMPRQRPDQVAALYTKTGNWQLLTEEESTYPSARRLAWLQQLCGGAGGRRLFEVGAGRGEFLAAARDAGWEVDGIEPASEGLRMAREIHGITLRPGLFTPDTHGQGDFDVICAWDVLEHCLDPDQVLAAMLSWVRPGGYVVVSVPHIDGYPARLFGAKWRYRMAPKHVHQFPLGWFDHQATQQGAAVAQVAAFAKVHAAVEGILPTPWRKAFRRQLPARTVKPSPSSAAQGARTGAAMPLARRARGLVRDAALRLNQTQVPLPMGDLIEVALRRD